MDFCPWCIDGAEKYNMDWATWKKSISNCKMDWKVPTYALLIIRYIGTIQGLGVRYSTVPNLRHRSLLPY